MTQKLTPTQIGKIYETFDKGVRKLLAHNVNDAMQLVTSLCSQTVIRIAENQGQETSGIDITIEPSGDNSEGLYSRITGRAASWVTLS